jgi:hypothetical protein
MILLRDPLIQTGLSGESSWSATNCILVTFWI